LSRGAGLKPGVLTLWTGERPALQNARIMMEMKTYAGGCHCGKVRFEVKTAELTEALACNCSICGKTGSLLTFVPAEQFSLVSGGDVLSDYQFGKKVIHHLFCTGCGIRSFANGTGPDGKEMYAVNVRCLDDVNPEGLKLDHFDGKNM